MKKIYLLFLFINQLSFAQSVMREYDYNDTLYKAQGFSTACKLYNGDLLVTGDVWDSVPYPYQTSRVQVTRMDANANVIWSKRFTQDQYYTRSVCADADGCYFTSRTSGSFCSLMHTDTSVSPTWMRHVTNGPFGFTTDISACRPAPGGGCYVTGTFRTTAPTGDLAWIMKLDTSGNTVWGKSYALANSDLEVYNTGIEVTNNGSIVLPFRISNSGLSSCGLIKLDSSGNTVWKHSFLDSDSTSIYPAEIKMLPDSGFIVSGGRVIPNSNQLNTFLFRTDKDGNELWYEYFDQECNQVARDRQSLTLLNNGNILFGFTNVITSIWTTGEMIECDLSGQVISAFRLGGLFLDTITISALLPSNGNLIAFGSRLRANSDGASYHPMTINFNSPGNAICNKVNITPIAFPSSVIATVPSLTESVGPSAYFMPLITLQNTPYSTTNCALNGMEDPAIQNNVSIYPNPSAGNITIDAHLLNGKSCELYLYDVSGRLLQTNTFQNTFLIERKGRAEGVYFIHLAVDGKSVYNGKILIAD